MSLPRSFVLLSLLVTSANAAHGDIAAGRTPLPAPPMVAPVKIVEANLHDLDPNVVAKIVIPGSLLPDLQVASHGARVGDSSPPVGTMIAGLALTAAAISLMFANQKSANWRKGVIGLIVCVVLVGIASLVNFISPPAIIAPVVDRSNPQQFIVIDIQQPGHEVTLILPSRP